MVAAPRAPECRLGSAMIATIILVVCLTGAPDHCEDRDPLLPPVGLTECAVLGQQMARDWLEDHPKYALKGWRCQMGERGRSL